MLSESERLSIMNELRMAGKVRVDPRTDPDGLAICEQAVKQGLLSPGIAIRGEMVYRATSRDRSPYR